MGYLIIKIFYQRLFANISNKSVVLLIRHQYAVNAILFLFLFFLNIAANVFLCLYFLVSQICKLQGPENEVSYAAQLLVKSNIVILYAYVVTS